MSAASAKEHVDVPALLAELWSHEAGAHLEPAAQMGSADRKAFQLLVAIGGGRGQRVVGADRLGQVLQPHALRVLDEGARPESKRSTRWPAIAAPARIASSFAFPDSEAVFRRSSVESWSPVRLQAGRGGSAAFGNHHRVVLPVAMQPGLRVWLRGTELRPRDVRRGVDRQRVGALADADLATGFGGARLPSISPARPR